LLVAHETLTLRFDADAVGVFPAGMESAFT
jgi:hypothetical protein